jgi:hypothetical protein
MMECKMNMKDLAARFDPTAVGSPGSDIVKVAVVRHPLRADPGIELDARAKPA